jgi:hypothetical protein
MFEGNDDVVGVAGRTFTDVWGLFVGLLAVETEGDASDAEDVEEAFECE